VGTESWREGLTAFSPVFILRCNYEQRGISAREGAHLFIKREALCADNGLLRSEMEIGIKSISKPTSSPFDASGG
jgi:hypothetical protein